jgi:hypothetical protein
VAATAAAGNELEMEILINSSFPSYQGEIGKLARLHESNGPKNFRKIIRLSKSNFRKKLSIRAAWKKFAQNRCPITRRAPEPFPLTPAI